MFMSSDEFDMCQLEECFTDKKCLIVTNKKSNMDKDKETTDKETEKLTSEHGSNSLYITLGHLFNLASNLGCVQKTSATPENKVCKVVM